MKLTVLSRRDAEDVRIEGRYAVISVTDPALPPATLPSASNCAAVLRLSFDDVTDEFDGYRPMSDDEADAVLAFVNEYRERVDGFVIHCEAGISRSRGIAVALAFIYELEHREHFVLGRPNPHVIQTLLRANARAAELTA